MSKLIFYTNLVIKKILMSRKFHVLLDLDQTIGEKHLNFRVEAISLGLFVGYFTGGYRFIRALLKATHNVGDKTSAIISGAIAGFAIIFVEKKRSRFFLFD